MKNIAIALNSGNALQRNAITQIFANEGWAYWHWIDDFWIVQVPETYTPKSLHLKLEESNQIGQPTLLMFEFQGNITFWGRANSDAWKWLGHIGGPSL